MVSKFYFPMEKLVQKFKLMKYFVTKLERIKKLKSKEELVHLE
jgi:hypothetical protein